jgi:hypothetical protein
MADRSSRYIIQYIKYLTVHLTVIPLQCLNTADVTVVAEVSEYPTNQKLKTRPRALQAERKTVAKYLSY